MTVYREDTTASLLGVTHEDMRTVRELLDQGPHWLQHDEKIALTSSGVSQVLVALGIPEKKLPATFWEDLKTLAGVEKTEPPREVIFLKKTRNPRVVVCRDDERLVRVQLRDPANFIFGMLLPVEHVADDLFRLVGPLPRFRGRWK